MPPGLAHQGCNRGGLIFENLGQCRFQEEVVCFKRVEC